MADCIWMPGVLIKYLVEKVLKFNHTDFMKTLKLDLGPILGDVGLFIIESYKNQAKHNQNAELEDKYAVAKDLI